MKYLKPKRKSTTLAKESKKEQTYIQEKQRREASSPFKFRGLFLQLGFGLALLTTIVCINISSRYPDVDYTIYQETFEDTFEVKVMKRTAHQKKKIEPIIEKVDLKKTPIVEIKVVKEEPIKYVPETITADDVEVEDKWDGVVDSIVLKPMPLPAEKVDDTPYDFVESMPRFPGCESNDLNKAAKESCAKEQLLSYIYANVKYPLLARENQIQGMVVVQFVVNRAGGVEDVKVVRDIGAMCGKAAKQAVESMNLLKDRWIPGMQSGRKVNVRYTLPIRFSLE